MTSEQQDLHPKVSNHEALTVSFRTFALSTEPI